MKARPPLEEWVAQGYLRPLDRAFATFLMEEAGEASVPIAVAAALASFESGQGHTCLDLLAIPDTPGPGRYLRSLPPEELLEALRLPALTDPDGSAPLAFLERPHPRLYLKRYYRYENRIVSGVRQRLSADFSPDPASDAGRVRAVLDALLPSPGSDWVRVACALAVRNRFSLITGGPGSGKTTAVTRVLAALYILHSATGEALSPDRMPRIKLAAPTGKAAGRLQESIAAQLESLPAAVREALPRRVSTVHRLLGMRGAGSPRYTRRDPLPADIVVIDEASMMDVELTAHLFEALPDQSRLILLGDKDQLASVESGAVLADLCLRAEVGHYTPETAGWIREATGVSVPAHMLDRAGAPLDQAITMLRSSFRFSAQGGIGLPADAVRRGAVQEVPTASTEGFRRLNVHSPDDERYLNLLRTAGASLRFMQEQRPQEKHPPEEARDRWAREVLEHYNRFRVLCVLREGPWGVVRTNERVRAVLEGDGLLPPGQEWYPGRPVLVTRNDYRLGLMNGDVGVALAVPAGLYVAFEGGPDGGIRWILPGRLQAVETVFAMTVHKAQGSEFEHVVLVIPDRDTPVLTRELVYTAITRARKEVTLVERDPALLEVAASRRLERIGGLGERLHSA